MNKYFALVAALLFGGASHAAYLYWQVDATDASGFDFNYARVVAVTDSSSKVLNITDDIGETISVDMVAVGCGAAINLDQLSDASAYSYYIELINYTSADKYDIVGTSKLDAWSYDRLVQSNFIDVGDVMRLPTTQVWHGGTYSVPEPTSAMLVMFGMGLLALKRKRV